METYVGMFLSDGLKKKKKKFEELFEYYTYWIPKSILLHLYL
jgi:hypothetical protein